MQQLRKFYKEEARKNVKEKLGYSTVMQVPIITKVVINMGFGKDAQDKKQVELHLKELYQISGQKPIATKAKKSIAGFKIREGAVIGGKVTLRNDHMFGFLAKMIHVVFPRVRDFNGVSRKAFDPSHNHTFGIKEQLSFPEVTYDQINKIRGFNITVVMKNVHSREAAILLLKELGWPWKREVKKEVTNG